MPVKVNPTCHKQDQVERAEQRHSRAHRCDSALLVHMGLAAEHQPDVLHICEVVDRLAELDAADAIDLRAHADACDRTFIRSSARKSHLKGACCDAGMNLPLL